jgi:hypothetical protein
MPKYSILKANSSFKFSILNPQTFMCMLNFFHIQVHVKVHVHVEVHEHVEEKPTCKL